MHVALYGCETWSLTLTEERRLSVFENRVLRGIFWPKRDEVTGKWRKLHNEELSNLFCSPNIVRVIKSGMMRWAGHVARMGRAEVYTGFWWGYLRERIARRRWEDKIKMDLQEVEYGDMDWVELA